MKEKVPTFNHGYLCQMLQAASDFDLANVILDVKKEQDRRVNEERQMYAEKIMEAIREAVESGYIVYFYSDAVSKDDPELCIHSNNLFITNVSVEEEEED